MDNVLKAIMGLSILFAIMSGVSIYNILDTKSNLESINQKLGSINNSLELESESHFTNIISNVKQSIVAVLSYPVHNNSGSDNVIYLDNGGKSWNLGTGFSINDEGYILTANHIVDNVDIVAINLLNGTTIPVSKIQKFPDLDLAILYINSDVPSANLQDTLVPLPEGMSIAFIGFPFSTEINGQNIPIETTVKGTVSATIPFTYKNQLVPVYVLGAAANKGNSGGPVFSLKTGEVIGIINQKIADKEGITISTVVTQPLINNLMNIK